MQVRREPLADQAAELLLTRIRAGEWQLGQKLPGETTLAPQLGVGRSTLREAIRQLAGRGVLASRQGAGVFVTALDVPEDWDLVLRRADIVSVIEARTAIEAEAAALAAVRRTPTELRAIGRALAARARRRPDVEEHVDADMAFHRAVVVAAHNPVLVDLFDSFVPRSRIAMVEMLRLGTAADHAADHTAHDLLHRAIADRDADLAARLSRTHLTSLKESLT
ncbi:FCD domain-containing protein [Pimelobacter simplex]|uniref:Transcriptional regulator, GntR family n=1 Tax=Nocardioides simplex TaxID=2045 RepID=A0A0A1DN15_NOCSI|nr:FCD domain-containing protein [Pimelobacter simplex]AIY16785.1 Transcriptional regulator, GntR family [Pimelobacter simplex]MCG8151852.1 FCD domain-containing protein [Pimelobacter simplex]GEB12609.1 GntR family transcriptional regulator [Pimelobacter simplex]SFM56973.1 DNA-binding transcriptional regulator, FadR family [Pimelobacter simplex]